MKLIPTTMALLAFAVIAPAHAAPLSRAYVYQVTSPLGGNETVAGLSTTRRDHGGSPLYILTDDIGYASNAQARLLGSPLREVRKVPLCNAPGGVAPCKAGGTVIGYRRTWDASGREGGNFQYVAMPLGIGTTVRVGFQVL